MYGAYVAEKFAQYYARFGGGGYQTYGGNGGTAPQDQDIADELPASDVRFLTMTSGYHSLTNSTCEGDYAELSVSECLAQDDNAHYTASDVGNFWYNSGHFQQHAALLATAQWPPPFTVGLGHFHPYRAGPPATDELADEFVSVLGLTVDPPPDSTTGPFHFSNPLLAGGIVTSEVIYAQFLRRVLNGTLQMYWLLGTHAVPAVCADGMQHCTPVPYPVVWDYSIGHWVEDDPADGDGSYSSGGAWGFYPWIWLQPQPGDDYGGWTTPLYGIVARNVDPNQVTDWIPSSIDDPEDTIGWTSVLCGQAIRRAFLEGSPQ